MAVSRIARVHLVYQFIILTILVFAIGYNEILPDKKYLFMTLIPVFSYQLLIVFCCTEVLPLPSWFSGEIQTEAVDTTAIGTMTTPTENKLVISGKRFMHKYEFKNKTIDVKESPIIVTNFESAVSEDLSAQDKCGTKTYPPRRKIETSKSYCFPQRQKRLENWPETKDIERPYKIRNWNSTKISEDHERQPVDEIANSEEEKSKKSSDSSTINNNINNNDDDDKQEDLLNVSNDLTTETPDLTKSYSFPFRQKKVEKWVEPDLNLVSDLNIPLMPQWKELDYCLSSNRVEKRRKSMSTEALDKELKLIKSRCQPEPTEHDFTQSVELPEPVNLVEDVPEKKINLRHVKSFNKIRQGIANCFNKKRESFKSDDSKQGEERKQFFKELFLSRESLNLDFDKKEEPPIKTRNIIRAKSESRDRYSPSYISFIRDKNFTDFSRADTVVKKDIENI